MTSFVKFCYLIHYCFISNYQIWYSHKRMLLCINTTFSGPYFTHSKNFMFQHGWLKCYLFADHYMENPIFSCGHKRSCHQRKNKNFTERRKFFCFNSFGKINWTTERLKAFFSKLYRNKTKILTDQMHKTFIICNGTQYKENLGLLVAQD